METNAFRCKMQEEKDHCHFNHNQCSCIESRISELVKLTGVSLASRECWPSILKLSDYLTDLLHDGRLSNINQTLTIMLGTFPLRWASAVFRFPWFCVFRSPGAEAGSHTEIQSTPSFGIHILHGRWLAVVPLNIQPQWEPYYLLNISGDVCAELRAQQAAPHPHFCTDS